MTYWDRRRNMSKADMAVADLAGGGLLSPDQSEAPYRRRRRRRYVRKHGDGSHDERDHGNWADGESSRESRDIEMDFGFTYRGGVVDGDTLQLAALKRFGETSIPESAGYVLSGGELLDMSGASEGGTPGVRAYDHRNIGDVYPDSYDIPEEMGAMRHFMRETGAIRIHVDGGTVLATIDVDGERPSNSALRQLVDMAEKELVLDLWSSKGDASVTIPEPDPGVLRRVMYSASMGHDVSYAERERD